MSKQTVPKAVALAAVFTCTLVFAAGCGGSGTQPGSDVSYLVNGNGGRVDWLEKNGTLACDLLGDDGNYRVWTIDGDGSNCKCLSAVNPDLPDDHHGNPAWHPSGDYLVIQCGDPTLAGASADRAGYLLYTNPGAGFHNNLWLITADGSSAWQLTAVEEDGGVLHPHFSHDGNHLVWAEMTAPGPRPFGTWVIQMADFSMRSGAPVLANVSTLRPGNLQFYETHGFSPDDSTLIFTGMRAGGTPRDLDVYVYELASGSLRSLTDPSLQEWDEHAHFTPDGNSIIWMSSMGIEQPPQDIDQFKLKTDYWMMNADGSDKRRISFFNQEGSAEYIPGGAAAADLSIAGDGRHFFAYVKDNTLSTTTSGLIVRIDINP